MTLYFTVIKDVSSLNVGTQKISHVLLSTSESLNKIGDNICNFLFVALGRDPPRMCFTAPQFDRVAQLCLRFYNMSYGRKEVTGCIRVEAELFSEVVASYELGCFDIDDVRNRIRDKWVDIKPFHKLWDADLQRNLTGTILRDTNDASRRSR